MEESSSVEACSSTTDLKEHPKQKISSKDHIFRKRKPTKPQKAANVIYVSTKTSTNVSFTKGKMHFAVVIYVDIDLGHKWV